MKSFWATFIDIWRFFTGHTDDGLRVQTYWAVVVTQLVEQLLPTPEIRGSNTVIGDFFHRRTFVNSL